MQLGIIGGGQLAMMLCESAKLNGYKTYVLDPNPKCSAKHVCDELIVSEYDSLENLMILAGKVDYITYEFENIDVKTLEKIENMTGKVVQGVKPLTLSNSRLHEKTNAKNAGLKPASYQEVHSIYEVQDFIDVYKLPVVVKTDRLGYDGKGQFVIKDKQDLENENLNQLLKQTCVCEAMIDIDFEFSVIAFRNMLGEISYLPPTKNVHKNNILHTSELCRELNKPEIKELVEGYLKFHKLTGIITFEFFMDKKGNIIFNEIAPRPHNSGHYSIEGCDYSQFDMHILSLLGLPLPRPSAFDSALMVNILGQDHDYWQSVIPEFNDLAIYYHDYHKPLKTENRKVGHITAVGDLAINILRKYIH